MTNILLDETEISRYENMRLDGIDGKGRKAQYALSQYTSRLGNLASQGFGPNDTSSAHAVIDELRIQMNKIAETTTDIGFMIDDLVRILKVDILDEEDRLANEVKEGKYL